MATSDIKSELAARLAAKRTTTTGTSGGGDVGLRGRSYGDQDTATGNDGFAPPAAHEPWDEDDADALADAYETAGHPIVDAAAWSRSPWLDTALVAPRPPRPAAIDQDWLNERLGDLAAHFEDTLRTLKSDDAITELGTRIDTVENRLSGSISTMAKSFDSVESRLSGTMSSVTRNLDGVENRVSGAVTKSLAASIQSASGNVPRQVTDAVSGVLASSAMTSVLDRTVSKAVTSAVNGHVTNSVTNAVNSAVTTAVAGAVGGAVTTALTGAVSGRMDAVTSAVTSAVNGSIAPAVNSAVASAVSSRMDVLSAAVTQAINGCVPAAVNSSVNERLDMLTTSMANAVADAVDDAVQHAVNGTLKTTVTEAIADGMHGALSEQIADAVTQAVSGAMTNGMSQAIEGAVSSTVAGAVSDALAQALPSAFVDVATKSDIDGLYGVQNQLADVFDRFDRTDERLARIEEIENQMHEITDRLSDERLSRFVGAGGGGGGGASAADIDQAARTASDMVAQEMLARMPAASAGDSAQINDIRALLETVISEQRQGDEMTSTMLDTLQQAMLAVLDRVDALETTAQRMTVAAGAAIADQASSTAGAGDREFRGEIGPISSNDPDEIADRIERMGTTEERAQPVRPTVRAELGRAEQGRPEPARIEGEQPRAQRRPGADNHVSDRLPMRAPGANKNIEPAKPIEPAKDEFISAARRAMRSTSGRDGDGDTQSAASAVDGRAPPRARSLASDTPSGATPVPRGKSDRRTLVAIIAVLALGAGYQLLSRPDGQTAIQQADADRAAITTVASADTSSDASELPATLAVAGGDTASTVGEIVEPGAVAPADAPSIPQGVMLTNGRGQLSPQEIMALRLREEAARLSAQVGVAAYQLPSAGTGIPIGMTPIAAPTAAASPTAAAPPVLSALDRRLAAGATSVGRAGPATTASVVRQPDLELPPVTVGPLSLRRAAGAGDASAQFEVAARLAEGRGTQQDFAGAIMWYTRAADQGFAAAQFRLATMYERGLGVAADIAQAKLLYNRAADRGHVKAMHNLAVLNASVKTADGEPDYAGALPWFQRAAGHGLTDSQFNLAVLLEGGLGLTKDIGQAYKWQSLAARGGDKQAVSRRDALSKQLDPAARDTIDREVTNFRPTPSDRVVNDARAAGEFWKSRSASAS